MMKCFENYFGEYPFLDDGYALVETPYLGMELNHILLAQLKITKMKLNFLDYNYSTCKMGPSMHS